MRLMLVRGSKNTAFTDIKLVERSQINMKKFKTQSNEN
jgi:hypothetical protein